MGPRNRRRLAIGAGIAGLIVAVVLAVVLTRPTSRSGHALSGLPIQCVSNGGTGGCTVTLKGVTFGMTPQQVQSALGEPATKHGRCWQYPQPVARDLAVLGVVKSVQDVCFFAGRFSDRSQRDYVRRHGKLVLWNAPPPNLP